MTQEARNHPLIFLVIACTFIGGVVWAISENVRVIPLEKEILKLKEIDTTLKSDYSSLKMAKDKLESEVKRLILKKPLTNKNCQDDNPSQSLESQLKIITDKNNQLVLDLNNCIANKPKKSVNSTKVNSSSKSKIIEYKKNGLIFSLTKCTGSNNITCKLNIKNTLEEAYIELEMSRKRVNSRAIDFNGMSYKVINISLGGNNGNGRDISTTIPKNISMKAEFTIENNESNIEVFSVVEINIQLIRNRKANYFKATFRDVPINPND